MVVDPVILVSELGNIIITTLFPHLMQKMREKETQGRERGPSRKGSILSSKRDSVLGLSIGGDTNLDKPPSRLGPSLGDRRESQLSATSATSNGGVGESRNGVIGGSRRNSRFRAKSDTE